MAVCQPHQALPVGFLLLPYSILFTAESLPLLYLLFKSWFICLRRRCIDKLGVFHANQISKCLDPHLNYGWGWRCETGLSPPVNVFLLTFPRRSFFFGTFLLVILRLCVLCCRVSSVWHCGCLLGLADLLAAMLVVLSLSQNISWSNSELRARLAPRNWFKPSSKMFYWPPQGGTSFVDHLCFSVLCLLCLWARLFSVLWSPAGKRLTSWLSFVVSNCECVIVPLVSWVSCGTWLYRFLIFGPLPTFICVSNAVNMHRPFKRLN